MNRNLLSGAALAAVVAASPALAQQPDDTLCVLNDLSESRITNDRILQLDSDGDGRITLVEYQQCLDANVAQGQRQGYMQQFTALDQDGDEVLILADLQALVGGAGGQQQADRPTGGQPAEVVVEEQAANVQVQQPAPTVRVDQAQPQVAVRQPEPQVNVQQREPQVRVEQRQPEVAVQQPEPTVQVEQPEAQVSVQQAQPQVSMDVPAPEVEVRQAQPQVQVEQRQPQVAVEQPEPEVRVEQAEANVQVETEEPRVVVEQAEPEVQIERVTSPDVTTRESAAASGEMEQEARAGGVTDAEAEETVALAETDAEVTADPALTAGLPFDQIQGEEVYNNAGEEIGEISEVVMEQATGELFVVVAAGGFLGIGETEIVFPYENVSMVEDRVVINTNITQGQLEERQDYDENLYVEVPEDRVAR